MASKLSALKQEIGPEYENLRDTVVGDFTGKL
jgi:hypothetical protein